MCDDIASHLREKGVKATGYHRGIRAGILEKTMKGWIGGAGVREADRVDVVCATSGFSPSPSSLGLLADFTIWCSFAVAFGMVSRTSTAREDEDEN